MSGQLDGRRIIVTGGARGIGECAVRAFTQEGAHVASLDLLDDAGQAAAEAATNDGPGHASYRHCDVSDRSSVNEAFDVVTKDLGGLDVMVNVAGVERRAPAETIEDADWDLIMNVNLRGTFLTNQAAFPHLRDAGGGRIINFGSGAGMYPFLNGAHYSASKAGVFAWTRTVAYEWAKHGITAVAIAPAMWTPMYEESRNRYDPEQLKAHDALMASRIPLGGRLGDPETDMAPVLIFLASDASKFITAQIIAVDGGMNPLR